MINYNDEKMPNYDLVYNRSLFRHYNQELMDASKEPEFDLNEYFYIEKQEHRAPEEIPRPSCSRRNKLFKSLRKPEPLYHTSLPLDNLGLKKEIFKQEPDQQYLNNFQRLMYSGNHANLPHSTQINYAHTFKDNVVQNGATTMQPQMNQFDYYLLFFSQLIKQCQTSSNSIEKQRECLQQPQIQANTDFIKSILEKYQEVLTQQSVKSEPTQEQDGKKDKPFVPYKKRHFSMIDDTSSGSNLSSNSSTDAKIKPVKPKREVDPNQPKKIKRCPHVWQFCADLLDNDNFNPSIIKWLNKEKGIFKIVKPDKVADLWGAQKNRKSDKKMNYEKMARGMRYSRREGFFKKLDKEKNKPNEYGKQLVFQFSDKVVRDFEWKWSFST